MVRLAPARPSTVPAAGVVVAQGLHVHGHSDVGPLPSHRGTLGAVEVPVGPARTGRRPALGGGAQVPPSSRPKLGIDLGLKRCQDGLSSLRVELSLHPDHPGRLSLHPDHPGRGGTDIEPASFPQGLGVAGGVPFVQRFRPLTDPPGEAPPPGGSGRLDQNCLRRPEGLRVLRSGLRQDPHRTRGPPLPERTPP